MHDLFPQYHEPSDAQFDHAWKHGTFVFDTNVLLNLYRYRKTTREELIAVLNKLSHKIWIPHQVALEFQRNRLSVIAEQARRFSEVTSAVNKAKTGLASEFEKLQLQKRHALIDPEPLIKGFDKLCQMFLLDLDMLSKSQQSLDGPDTLRETLEALFDDKVGKPPEDQISLDKLYEEAERRYKCRIPPGYLDAKKESSDESTYVHRGLYYNIKYGDYLVWKQVLEYARDSQIENLLFITDDSKDDWWRKIDLNGSKTIGPRPELIEEALEFGQVKCFLMYSPEGFLKYAKDVLQADISEDALQEVRSVSRDHASIDLSYNSTRFAIIAQEAIEKWLVEKYGSIEVSNSLPVDYLVTKAERRIGFDVRVLTGVMTSYKYFKDVVLAVDRKAKANKLDQVEILLAIPDESLAQLAQSLCFHLMAGNLDVAVSIQVGLLDLARGLDNSTFIPTEIYQIGKQGGWL